MAVLHKWVSRESWTTLRKIGSSSGASAASPRESAQDDEGRSFDPNDERFGPNGTLQRKKQLNGAQDAKRRRIAQDARWTSALTRRIRGLVQRYTTLVSAETSCRCGGQEVAYRRAVPGQSARNRSPCSGGKSTVTRVRTRRIDLRRLASLVGALSRFRL